MAPNLFHPPGLAALTTLVRDCSVSGVGRKALLLRTDLLPPRLSRPHHLRLAQEALIPLLDADRACRYELDHARLAISWRGNTPDRLRRALEHLEHLLLDAPLEAPAMPELARLFDLPEDGAALLALASSPSVESRRQRDADARVVPPAPLPPIDPAMLESMEARLTGANVARFARRRAVCRMDTGSFETAWETRFLSVHELMDELAPGCNPFGDIWLFRRLTRMLDRRMLSLLSTAAELRGAGPFGLDLNVGGVLSAEFLKFDAALPAHLRGHAVLNLTPEDVMADLPAYRFARAFARARGYRILLRGLTPLLLSILDLPSLDLDFVELRWSPGLVGLDPALLRAGTARWVLSRADEAGAIRWGGSVGIGLFGGDAVRPGALQARPPRALAAPVPGQDEGVPAA